MRSYQVFASLSSEHAAEMMGALSEKQPNVYLQALAAAAAAMKARPVYLQRQPHAKRAEAVRRALARVASNAVANEVLAVYFLECRRELLTEWLDLVGLEHEEGTLSDDAPASPPEAALRKAVKSFLGNGDDPDRGLLLSAFAAQESIAWPDLEALLSR